MVTLEDIDGRVIMIRGGLGMESDIRSRLVIPDLQAPCRTDPEILEAKQIIHICVEQFQQNVRAFPYDFSISPRVRLRLWQAHDIYNALRFI
jgi:hypothetical protein